MPAIPIVFAACFQHFQQMHCFPSACPTQANAALGQGGHQSTWLQKALSAFVKLRSQASEHTTLNLMPLAVTASTLVRAAELDSAPGLVVDVCIYPLTTQQMWDVIKDLSQRLGHSLHHLGRLPGEAHPAHVNQVLKFVGGNPRHLAWAISGMSRAKLHKKTKHTLLLGRS